MSYVLGVTGGIASGKSTVVNVFKRFRFPVVDGDLVARKVVEPATDGLAAITKQFGEGILNPNGTLNRKKLGKIVFHDPVQRKKLNQTLDPFIRTEIDHQINDAKLHSALVIADIPLMYETHYDQAMDAVAVVYVDSSTQLKRLMARDHYSEEEAMERINSQMSLDEKRHLAHYVFDNRGTIDETEEQVILWLKHHRFL
ncbi:dephospho-CoA kinase [Enterococcus florum]|uniref:Dephospho-CoA kinase n=1 Tax=Enterococcus florum TaxID=2480627 RepID=A0A4P5PE07_9ENTE|nr:dephospho-CoA kinase [Enterococcus florum]GCF94521.1 dephospho-CoA kinase [Enterococcus florum]